MQYFGFDRPSSGIKTYGFGESSPKLQADFTTGTYKASGAAKTFADLFTFNRAGKAWLVKDTGLQEYATDVPRFDDGLLIEQSATNYAAWSFLPENGSYIKGGVIFSGGHWVYDEGTTNNPFLYPQPYPDLSQGNRIFSTVGVGGRFASIRAGIFLATISVGSIDYYVKIEPDTSNLSGLVYPKIEGIYALYYQVEGINPQQLPTSPIKTTTAPVTRPADFLLNNITGTTVTGDWDSTLNLSIVAGKLVHSGYGRIRSLEIN